MNVHSIDTESNFDEYDEYKIHLTRRFDDKEFYITMTGKEINRIIELVNTYNKIQDNPNPVSGFGDILSVLKTLGGK